MQVENAETWRAVDQLDAALAVHGQRAAEAMALRGQLRTQLGSLVGPAPIASIDLWDFALEAVRDVTPQDATEIVSIVDPVLPRRVETEIPGLKEAVRSLLGAAAMATRSGSITLRFSSQCVTSQRGPTGLRLHVWVEDTRTATATPALTALRQRVAQSGGSVETLRPEAGGLKVGFDLPAHTVPTPVAASLGGRRILLVDDHRIRREAARAVLLADGAQVQETGDPRAAMRLAQTSGPDVVVIDLALHGGAGLSLLRRLRQRFEGPIVCVGPDSRELAEEARAAGADGWRCRPLGRTLAEGVAAVLRQATSSGPKVLVVEHEASARRSAQAMMRRFGCEVEGVTNGPEALERLADRQFDLVFLNCRMPGMDGFETVKRLRSSGKGAERVPVIGMTDQRRGRDGCRALEAGMNDYVAKPLDGSVLRAAFSRWSKPPRAVGHPSGPGRGLGVIAEAG